MYLPPEVHLADNIADFVDIDVETVDEMEVGIEVGMEVDLHVYVDYDIVVEQILY